MERNIVVKMPPSILGGSMQLDIILRRVPRYGWLPIIEEDGKEKYRGEYQTTPAECLQKSIEWLEEKE